MLFGEKHFSILPFQRRINRRQIDRFFLLFTLETISTLRASPLNRPFCGRSSPLPHFFEKIFWPLFLVGFWFSMLSALFSEKFSILKNIFDAVLFGSRNYTLLVIVHCRAEVFIPYRLYWRVMKAVFTFFPILSPINSLYSPVCAIWRMAKCFTALWQNSQKKKGRKDGSFCPVLW